MSSPSADAVNARIDQYSLGVTVSSPSATTAAQPPAGGTGATAGAYDSASNRDAMISALNNLRIDHDSTRVALDSLIAQLKDRKLIPPA